MSSQLSFVTSGLAGLARLDAQIRLEHVVEDLDRLRRRIGYTLTDVPAGAPGNEETKLPEGKRRDLVAARGLVDAQAREVPGRTGGTGRGGRGRGRGSGGGAEGWKCALGRENQANGKGGLPVDSADFTAALRRSPALIQRLCTVYMQDFICLGYTLPPECVDGRALEWLPPVPIDRSRNPGRRDPQSHG
jgi:hypothetical protein